MKLPAVVLAETTWTSITGAAAALGAAPALMPLVTVNGEVPAELPAVEVAGILGLPLSDAVPATLIEDARAAISISPLGATGDGKFAGAVADANSPAAVGRWLEKQPSVVVGSSLPCGRFGEVFSGAMARFPGSRPAGEEAVWSLALLLAGRGLAQGKLSSAWVLYGLGQDAVLGRAQREGDFVRFVEAKVFPGCGADAIAATFAACIYQYFSKQAGLQAVLGADSPLRRHLVALCSVVAAQAVRAGENGSCRLERRLPSVPSPLFMGTGISSAGAAALGCGFAVNVNTSLQQIRKKLISRPLPALARALAQGGDVIVPDGPEFVGPNVPAVLRLQSGVRVIAISPRETLKFVSMGPSTLAGKPYFASVAELSTSAALGGFGVVAEGTTAAATPTRSEPTPALGVMPSAPRRKVCPACAGALSESATTCPQCDFALGPPAPPPPPPPRPKTTPSPPPPPLISAPPPKSPVMAASASIVTPRATTPLPLRVPPPPPPRPAPPTLKGEVPKVVVAPPPPRPRVVVPSDETFRPVSALSLAAEGLSARRRAEAPAPLSPTASVATVAVEKSPMSKPEAAAPAAPAAEAPPATAPPFTSQPPPAARMKATEVEVDYAALCQPVSYEAATLPKLNEVVLHAAESRETMEQDVKIDGEPVTTELVRNAEGLPVLLLPADLAPDSIISISYFRGAR